MGSLMFGVLGALEVRRDGRVIAVTAPQQRGLLARLILRANEPVSQEELIDSLWDGNAPPTARAAFQNLIHALRNRVGPAALERTASGYLLHVEDGALDADRFRRLTGEARGLPPVERAAKLKEALALWRGAPFPELVGDPTAQAALARLEEERLSALEERIEADLEVGEHAVLVPELEQLVARHPLRERFRAQLMLALYRAGRQADALASYRRAHERFVEDLGIGPGVVLRELQRAILVQDSALGDPKQTLGSTLERAAAILPRKPGEQAESLLEYGSALIRLGELSQAASTLQAAGRLAATAGERGLEERVRVRLSYLAVFADGGSMHEHLAVAERAARTFEDLADEGGLAFALSHQAHMHRDSGHAELALDLARRGVALAARAGDIACEAACRRMAATSAAVGPTPVDEAIALCEAAEATCEETVAHSVWDPLAWLLAQSGRIAEARALYEHELSVLRQRGLLLHLIVGMAHAALAERAAGDLGRAADHLRMVYALERAENMRGDLPAVAGDLACVLAMQGEDAEAERLAGESRALAASGDILSEVLWRRGLAIVAAHEGRLEEALRLSADARARAGRTDWLTFRGGTLEDASYVKRLAGDSNGALEALQEALLMYRQKGNVAGADRVRRTLAGSETWDPTPPHVLQQS